MAELTRLREENARLREEVAALAARLARYEAAAPDGSRVTDALAHAFAPMSSVAASDWIATYWGSPPMPTPSSLCSFHDTRGRGL